MKRWKEDVRGYESLDYVVFKDMPMRESKWGDIIIDMPVREMERLAAEAVIERRVPLRGLEVEFLRNALDMTFQQLANELGVSPSTIFKWEQKQVERLDPFNEVALRTYFAEKLEIELQGKFSQLIGTEKTPKELILKIS